MMAKMFSHLILVLVINLAVTTTAQLFWVIMNNDGIENQTVIANMINHGTNLDDAVMTNHDTNSDPVISGRSSGLENDDELENVWVHYRTNSDNNKIQLLRSHPIIPKIQLLRTNPGGQTMQSLRKNPVGQTMQSLKTNPGGHIFKPKSCTECSCGLKFQNKNFVKRVSQKFEFPWLTLLYYKNKFVCGGALINDRYVLTAAHCVDKSESKHFLVRFHEFSQFQKGVTAMTTVKVTQIIMHPNFNSVSLDYDYAILKLEKPIDLSEPAPRPICLPIAGNSYAGELAQDAGWGYEMDEKSLPGQLRTTILRIVPNTNCNKLWDGAITRRMICIDSKAGPSNVCYGDSGGPLMVVQNGRYRIAGVNSYVEKCENPKLPAVVSRVTTVLPWIKANTEDGCYCSDKK